MPTGPHEPFRRGQPLSARRLNESADAGYRADHANSGGAQQSFHLGDGTTLHSAFRRPMPFRVTGKFKLDPYSPDPEGNVYSGVQLFTDAEGDVGGLGPGAQLECYVDYLPLVNVNGRDDVPDGTAVVARPSPQGDHLTFEYQSPLCVCDCVNSPPGTATLWVPAVTPRTFVQAIGGNPAHDASLPAGVKGTFTLSRSDAPPNPENFTHLYSRQGCQWTIWARRTTPVCGHEWEYRVYLAAQLNDGNWVYAAQTQLIVCRGTLLLPGDNTLAGGPNVVAGLSLYVLIGPDGRPYKPKPPTIPDPNFIAYYNLGWRACPGQEVPNGGPAYVAYLHLQMPDATLNDGACMPSLGGHFLRADVQRLYGTDCGIFGGMQLGGAMPRAFGGGHNDPGCCAHDALLYSYSPGVPEAGDEYPIPAHQGQYGPRHYRLRMEIQSGTLRARLCLDQDEGHLVHPHFLDPATCSTQGPGTPPCPADGWLEPHGDPGDPDDPLHYFADLYLFVDPDVLDHHLHPLVLCGGCEVPSTDVADLQPPVCFTPTDSRNSVGYVGVRYKITVVRETSLAGVHDPDPNTCAFCPGVGP